MPWFAAAGQWIPVLLPLHSDPEISLEAASPHWHLDYRFLQGHPYVLIGDRQDNYDSRQRLNTVAWLRDREGEQLYESAQPRLRVMRCRRAALRPALFPPAACARVEASLSVKRIVDGKCPHRGVDLSGCEAMDGKIICPAHGLVFAQESGQLVGGQAAADFRGALWLREGEYDVS